MQPDSSRRARFRALRPAPRAPPARVSLLKCAHPARSPSTVARVTVHCHVPSLAMVRPLRQRQMASRDSHACVPSPPSHPLPSPSLPLHSVRHTDRPIGSQANKPTDTQTDRSTGRQAGRQADRPTNRQAGQARREKARASLADWGARVSLSAHTPHAQLMPYRAHFALRRRRLQRRNASPHLDSRRL